VRLLSYQAMAHGADTCLFFQMRQSAAGQEKFHGALVSHAGHGNTRVFREAEKLGRELETLGDTFLRARTAAKAALLMDWNCWWALELASGPSRDMDYLKTLAQYYKPFHDRNIPVDIVNPAADTDYFGYRLVVAPMLYMTKPGVAERLTDYVKSGGTLIATVMSGLADENDRCVFGEYPGRLRDVLGIWVEETDALRPEERNRIIMNGETPLPRKEYGCGFLCDLIHARAAVPLAVYGDDFYAGMPCVTKNAFGKGTAYYIGTQPEDAFLGDLTAKICEENGIQGVYAADAGVEITRRQNENGATVFVLNHNQAAAAVRFGENRLTDLLTGETVAGTRIIEGRDVMILREET
jgi:beta-galactosidase